MAEYIPNKWDRVRLARNLGGHLTEGRIAIVVEVDDAEKGVANPYPMHCIIPWLKEEVPLPGGHGPWRTNEVLLTQFDKSAIIPLGVDEVVFIDNIYGR